MLNEFEGGDVIGVPGSEGLVQLTVWGTQKEQIESGLWGRTGWKEYCALEAERIASRPGRVAKVLEHDGRFAIFVNDVATAGEYRKPGKPKSK